ncbi:MAG: SH3 domain-containing protein [Aliidongia sp.]
MAIFAATLLAPAAVKAQPLTVSTTTTVVLRAGPGVEYPHVSVIHGGTPVTVYGCLSGWSWCDVSFRDARGWVAGGYLSTPYNGRTGLLPNLGARLGLPITPFRLRRLLGPLL